MKMNLLRSEMSNLASLLILIRTYDVSQNHARLLLSLLYVSNNIHSNLAIILNSLRKYSQDIQGPVEVHILGCGNIYIWVFALHVLAKQSKLSTLQTCLRYLS